jgi:hypothetical protein
MLNAMERGEEDKVISRMGSNADFPPFSTSTVRIRREES